MGNENPLENLTDKLVEVHCRLLIKFGTSTNKEDIESYYKNFTEVKGRFYSAREDCNCINKLIQKLEDKITPKERTLLQLSSYLIHNEGINYNFTDYMCYLLVLDGHDLFDSVRDKYVKNINEIAKVGMFSKIMFLNNHGFKELTKHYDLEFRNDIAHHKYTIDEDGHIWIKGKQVNILTKSKKLDVLIDFFTSLLTTLAKESEELVKQEKDSRKNKEIKDVSQSGML